MEQWHLLYTKPKQEPLVNRQLENRDLEVFFPTLQFERGYGRGIRMEAFFPNYLFVKVDMTSDQATGLRWLPGVRTIVHFGSKAAVVPDSVVETLRTKLEPYADQVMRKGEWLFKPGQHVKITNGPFQGLDAVFQKDLGGHGRVQVLLSVLGRLTRTELEVDQLETAT